MTVKTKLVIECERMATAFSEDERAKIKIALLEAARQCAAKYGMKKTSVDDLAASAGISKGMFYKFYPTKEMLFFEMLEQLHTYVYGKAQAVLEKRLDLKAEERLAEAFLAAIAAMEEVAMLDFYENEMAYLLRKIPDAVLKEHYHSDDQHIEEFMQLAGFKFTVPPKVVSAVMRALVLTVSHRKEIGEYYPEVLKLLVYSTCNNILN
jgi:AcrR family transcriptional regulator